MHLPAINVASIVAALISGLTVVIPMLAVLLSAQKRKNVLLLTDDVLKLLSDINAIAPTTPGQYVQKVLEQVEHSMQESGWGELSPALRHAVELRARAHFATLSATLNSGPPWPAK